ncbi:MAG TPA: helix-turn-helix transcriptional regulator [Chloroflexota bacterium]|jgi:transcriptional regulator with XRE-family HTH domain|nr:helix-turn-helix transcriptional regulator [Chloroflexota bacterium]
MAEDFARLLRQFRERAGLSCNELARLVAVDPSYISRLERGEREPPRRLVVERLAAVLALPPFERDRLLVSAGYTPASIEALGGWDATLQAVAEVLADPRVPTADRQAFRQVIDLLAERWRRFAPRAS